MTTSVVSVKGVSHDVSAFDIVDGGDIAVARTCCGQYIRESVFTLEPKPGVPTCFECVVGRRQLEHMARVLDDAGATTGLLEQMLKDSLSDRSIAICASHIRRTMVRI
jgi:hypothetical protein